MTSDLEADVLAAALRNLDTAIADTNQPIPCSDPATRLRWTSKHRDERTQAAQACEPCPVLGVCLAAGQTATSGVWGGVDRDDTGPDRNPTRPCAVCGSMFTPRRHDSRACSTRCRRTLAKRDARGRAA